MTKIIAADCSGNVVTADGKTVVAEVLSQGTKPSEGVLALDGLKAVYLTSNAADIKKLIEDVVAIINQVSVVLTGLDGVTTTPGSNAAGIVVLTTLKTQLNLTKDNLK